MSWHPFQVGHAYPLDEVLAICEEYIRDGNVKRVEGKEVELEQMRNLAPSMIVWSPSSTGWGASPLNPTCWRTPEGQILDELFKK